MLQCSEPIAHLLHRYLLAALHAAQRTLPPLAFALQQRRQSEKEWEMRMGRGKKAESALEGRFPMLSHGSIHLPWMLTVGALLSLCAAFFSLLFSLSISSSSFFFFPHPLPLHFS